MKKLEKRITRSNLNKECAFIELIKLIAKYDFEELINIIFDIAYKVDSNDFFAKNPSETTEKKSKTEYEVLKKQFDLYENSKKYK